MVNRTFTIGALRLDDLWNAFRCGSRYSRDRVQAQQTRRALLITTTTFCHLNACQICLPSGKRRRRQRHRRPRGELHLRKLSRRNPSSGAPHLQIRTRRMNSHYPSRVVMLMSSERRHALSVKGGRRLPRRRAWCSALNARRCVRPPMAFMSDIIEI